MFCTHLVFYSHFFFLSLYCSIYDDDLYGGKTRAEIFERCNDLAKVRMDGGGGDAYFEHVWRYWDPVMQDPKLCDILPVRKHPFRVAAAEQAPKVEVTAEDEAFMQDLEEKMKRAGKRRRKDVFYL